MPGTTFLPIAGPLGTVLGIFIGALLLVVITVVPGVLTAIQSLSPNNIARQIANTHTLFALFAVAV